MGTVTRNPTPRGLARIAWPLAVLIACVVVFNVAVAQQAVTVHGQVKGVDGQPKRFASVSLEGPAHYAGVSDANGMFTIANVAPGTYTVRVRQGDLVAEFTQATDNPHFDLKVKW